MQYAVSTRFLTDLRSPPVGPMRGAIFNAIRKLSTTPEAGSLQVRRLEFSDAWYCRVNANASKLRASGGPAKVSK